MNEIAEIYLPASAPDNFTYGKVPANPAIVDNAVFNVRFEKEVWYNREWRALAMVQLRPILCNTNILIGFSKSGLGALNMAIENPQMFQSIIIFDAPLCHKELPPWNTSSFYSQSTWEDDYPANCLTGLKSLSRHTKIIHIGGANFHQDHQEFYELLQKNEIQNHFLSRPHLSHSWESGWISEAIELAI